jgi:hypothetical protein
MNTEARDKAMRELDLAFRNAVDGNMGAVKTFILSSASILRSPAFDQQMKEPSPAVDIDKVMEVVKDWHQEFIPEETVEEGYMNLHNRLKTLFAPTT